MGERASRSKQSLVTMLCEQECVVLIARSLGTAMRRGWLGKDPMNMLAAQKLYLD